MNKLKKQNKKKAEGDTFACQFFYFLMKGFVLYLLYLYKNHLHYNLFHAILYVLLLVLNSYLILTVGNNPGYAPIMNQQQQSLSEAINSNICEICFCKKFLRMKHCYQCERCVYKYDHHCPWTGSCVGEFNHSDFWIFSFFQSVQAVTTFLIFLSAFDHYSYSSGNSYSKQFGAIVIFTIFTVIYCLFVGGLFGFHTYVIAVNTTSYQINKSHKLNYLNNGKNPFDRGLLNNIKIVFFHNKKQPILWMVTNPQQKDKNTSLKQNIDV